MKFLAIPTDHIPQWTKYNVPTYALGYFSNDGSYLLIDDAHPVSTYEKWLGPNKDILQELLSKSIRYSKEEIEVLLMDSTSIWYKGG